MLVAVLNFIHTCLAFYLAMSYYNIPVLLKAGDLNGGGKRQHLATVMLHDRDFIGRVAIVFIEFLLFAEQVVQQSQ